MRTLPILVASALLASIGGTVGAAVLSSAPIEVYPSGQRLSCNIVNLNSMPRYVTIELLDYSGEMVAEGTFGLQPNHGQSLSGSGDAESGYAAWCRFTVDGSARSYRAVAIYDDGGRYTTAIPAQ